MSYFVAKLNIDRENKSFCYEETLLPNMNEHRLTGIVYGDIVKNTVCMYGITGQELRFKQMFFNMVESWFSIGAFTYLLEPFKTWRNRI